MAVRYWITIVKTDLCCLEMQKGKKKGRTNGEVASLTKPQKQGMPFTPQENTTFI